MIKKILLFPFRVWDLFVLIICAIMILLIIGADEFFDPFSA